MRNKRERDKASQSDKEASQCSVIRITEELQQQREQQREAEAETEPSVSATLSLNTHSFDGLKAGK